MQPRRGIERGLLGCEADALPQNHGALLLKSMRLLLFKHSTPNLSGAETCEIPLDTLETVHRKEKISDVILCIQSLFFRKELRIEIKQSVRIKSK